MSGPVPTSCLVCDGHRMACACKHPVRVASWQWQGSKIMALGTDGLFYFADCSGMQGVDGRASTYARTRWQLLGVRS